MKVVLFVGYILILSFETFSQTLGNEWINFNQSYYKASVAQDDIYRISYDDLLNAGLPVSSIDPRKLQVYHKGVEQAIRVTGQSDATLDPGDYLEFYGQVNNGSLDAELYDPPNLQPHNLYSLFTDSTSYFITWLPPGPSFGKRMPSFFENHVSGLPKEIFHNAEILLLFTDQYSAGRTINNFTSATKFIEGEGWTGPKITENSSQPLQDIVFSGISNTIVTMGNPILELLLVGRNTAIDHDVRVSVGSIELTGSPALSRSSYEIL